ncbi:DNA-directed RNA polymerase I and III 14 KDA polypeptide [Metarhizium rileyi]|uniref:DNA-directed RNA polymerase I and III 14 kDa polypeptide n=1 Tax=Metarhizium rileyi (strain RCEF 4871) TaxID=1649241 RepID=A0A167DZU7_METRR|nr:DNA-directed RNA polymerase I and III 14 KDA polypeptide [Metarhizium rileyi RCEF 4871]
MPGRTNKADESSQDANMDDAPPSAQVAAVEDAEMEDDAEGEEEEEVEPQRVKILPGSTDTAASFDPDVEFCAYTIPHPSEPKMNIRIQTYAGTAVDALKKGLADLQDVCDVVSEEFWTKRQAFSAEGGIEV